MRVGLLGAGPLAHALLAALGPAASPQGHIAIARSHANLARAEALGATPIAADLAALPEALPSVDWWVYTAPPAPQGDSDTLLRAALARLPRPRLGVLYCSTTGVYGDCGGRWITESEPLRPQQLRSLRRMDAERQCLAYAGAQGLRLYRLRLPGLYSAARLPRQRIHSGAPVLRAEDCPASNRIHETDAAAAMQCLLTGNAPSGAYHLADGSPSTLTHYYQSVAQALGLPALPELPRADVAQLGAGLQSYLEENRRLDCARLRALGWAPRYPDLAAGLAAAMTAQP